MRTLTTRTTARLLATTAFALTAQLAGAAFASEGGGPPPPPPPPSFGTHLQVVAEPGGNTHVSAQSDTASSLERGVVGDSYAKAEVSLSPAPFARAQATNNSEAGISQAIATFQYNISVTAPDQAHALLLLSQLNTPGAIATAFGHASVDTFGGEGNVDISTGGNGAAPYRMFFGCQDEHVGADCGQDLTFNMPLFFHQSATNSLLFTSNFTASAEADAFNVLGAFANAYVDPMITLNFDLAAEGFTLTLADGSSVGNAIPGAGGVPEPAAWALMIAGFGGVGMAVRRRRAIALAA